MKTLRPDRVLNIKAILLGAAALLALAQGCTSMHPAPRTVTPELRHAEQKREGSWHSVVLSPEPNLRHIQWYKKCNPLWWFGNTEEPTPPGWYRPGRKHRVFSWHVRNLLNNFDYYVIGVADKTTVRSGKYPTHVFNPHQGWNSGVTKYKRLRLPFVSYKHGQFEFYAGWRESGNFGLALRREGKKPPKQLAKADAATRSPLSPQAR